MKFALLLMLGALCAVSAMDTYNGYKVFRMWPETEAQKNVLRNLKENNDLEFWSDVYKIDLPVDIMVKPEHQVRFIKEMHNIGLEVSVHVDNIEEMMKDQKLLSYSKSGMTWTAYYKLDDINAWLDDLVKKYPKQVSIEIGGSSYEGRDIKGLKISFGSGKKSVIIEGGIHGCEWISPATVTYIINELLTSTDPNFRKIAESFDWYIFPVTNPDGYSYSHTSIYTRLWRKTRTIYSETCIGADPNRNFDFYWGQNGTSSSCSSVWYGGPSAFSEKITETFSQYIRTKASNMVAYFSFHSFSQMILVPYGNTTDHLDNYNETIDIGKAAADALALRYGTRYRVGSIAETLYSCSGISVDWVKNEFKTPLAYSYELRDRGPYGFLLPANQILPNNEEILDSLIALFLEADKMEVVSLT